MRRAANSSRYHVPISGFSQSIVVPADGTFIFASGLTARTADGTVVAVGDYAGQTRQILENLRVILAESGASLDDVVALHTFMRDITQWQAVQSVWEEYWGGTFPASTAVQIVRLFDERQLIEIEAIARVDRQI
jgi:enamine deaminase RidA (YjgF/YER057c/UK114 family)